MQAFIDGELLYLAAHPYGNYGVQVALRHCSLATRPGRRIAFMR